MAYCACMSLDEVRITLGGGGGGGGGGGDLDSTAL